MIKNSRHVVPRQGGWAVKKSGASRASKVFDTQEDAITYGRSQAKKESGELYVHRKDGTILKRDSYGHAPNPPSNR
ncbi:MAG: DUF2188 domain-containing protein [Chlorobiaceae bacterium]|nr:DUF2188 domain-containing protein [Chlorobiaceae bacterium]